MAIDCAACGKPNLESAAYCLYCAAPMPAPHGVEDSAVPPLVAPPPEETPRASGARPGTLWLLATILLLFASLLAAAAGLRNHAAAEHPSVAESVGFLLGGMTSPFLVSGIIVLLYYKLRKFRRPGYRILMVFATWSLAWSLFAFAGSLRRGGTPPTVEDVARIFREAARGEPSTRMAGKWDLPIRAFFDDVFAMRRQYEAAVAQFHAPALDQLYEPSSFSNRRQVEEVLRELREMIALDKKFASLDPLIERMKERLREVQASDSERAAIVRGFENGFLAADALRQDVLQKEIAWADVCIDLYDYTLKNYQFFSVRGDEILIANAEVRETFNAKMTRANDAQVTFHEAQQKMENSQKSQMEKLGVAPSEF